VYLYSYARTRETLVCTCTHTHARTHDTLVYPHDIIQPAQERTFSDGAMVVAVKHPKYAFLYLTDLLGVPAESAVVKTYLERFPHHVIEPHPERGTVVFRVKADDADKEDDL
jgi:hypothetical protein